MVTRFAAVRGSPKHQVILTKERLKTIPKSLGKEEEEKHSGHHSEFKPSGPVHETCQIAIAHRGPSAQEQGNIPKNQCLAPRCKASRIGDRVMTTCVPSLNDCSQLNHCNVIRAKNGWKIGETHDNDRESMYLCFVACLVTVWLHVCHTCRFWTPFG